MIDWTQFFASAAIAIALIALAFAVLIHGVMKYGSNFDPKRKKDQNHSS